MAIIKRRPQVTVDIADIWEYIAIENDSPMNAYGFVEKLEQQFIKLAQNPLIGTSRNEIVPNLRGWPFGNYLIFYFPLDNGIELIRVLNAKRDWKRLKF